MFPRLQPEPITCSTASRGVGEGGRETQQCLWAHRKHTHTPTPAHRGISRHPQVSVPTMAHGRTRFAFRHNSSQIRRDRNIHSPSFGVLWVVSLRWSLQFHNLCRIMFSLHVYELTLLLVQGDIFDRTGNFGIVTGMPLPVLVVQWQLCVLCPEIRCWLRPGGPSKRLIGNQSTHKRCHFSTVIAVQYLHYLRMRR